MSNNLATKAYLKGASEGYQDGMSIKAIDKSSDPMARKNMARSILKYAKQMVSGLPKLTMMYNKLVKAYNDKDAYEFGHYLDKIYGMGWKGNYHVSIRQEFTNKLADFYGEDQSWNAPKQAQDLMSELSWGRAWMDAIKDIEHKYDYPAGAAIPTNIKEELDDFSRSLSGMRKILPTAIRYIHAELR